MLPTTMNARTGANNATRTDNMVALRINHLSKRYGERVAVNDLTLEVRRGEIVGFLGPNGAGKTTTIRMCLGLIAPTAGNVEVLGREVTARVERGASPLARVGALVEQPALYPYMTGRDNLRAIGFPLGGASEARIDAVLAEVGLLGRDRDRVKTYSLGMKQRLGVAIALLNDPDLVILDEPANGLDPAGIVEMRDLLRRLAVGGKAIFLSSHVLGEVQQICTRVVIINHGRLITESTVEALTTAHGEYAVTIDRPREALALLRAQPWGRDARPASDRLIVTPAPDGDSGALNRFLVTAGFTPTAITAYAQDLEAIFWRLTGE